MDTHSAIQVDIRVKDILKTMEEKLLLIEISYDRINDLLSQRAESLKDIQSLESFKSTLGQIKEVLESEKIFFSKDMSRKNMDKQKKEFYEDLLRDLEALEINVNHYGTYIAEIEKMLKADMTKERKKLIQDIYDKAHDTYNNIMDLDGRIILKLNVLSRMN